MTRRAESIVPKLLLHRSSYYFECPYCHKTWERGGKKEGFVKAGANNHVYTCWEVVLWILGWTPSWKGDTRIALPREQLDKRNRKLALAAAASRKRAGLYGQLVYFASLYNTKRARPE